MTFPIFYVIVMILVGLGWSIKYYSLSPKDQEEWHNDGTTWGALIGLTVTMWPLVLFAVVVYYGLVVPMLFVGKKIGRRIRECNTRQNQS